MQTKTPWWHPEAFARRRPALDARQRVIAGIRRYFADQEFAEVETPALQVAPGAELHLHAFKTELRDPHGGRSAALYLHTSPEITMKKLLVAGVPRLYQLAHVFRNNERSSMHHPEFLMLEWYRADADLGAIMKDCVELVRMAARAGKCSNFTAKDMSCDPFAAWETLSVPDAFARHAGIDLLATAKDSHKPDRDLLAKEAERIGVRVTAGDQWDDLFFRIMGECIEPHLGTPAPTFLCDYPVSMAALARPKASDGRLAERFELYVCGIELANAFGELTDANEQERRFRAEMALKKAIYQETWPVDEEFIAALVHGLPECAGIALGVDRLIMLVTGTQRIDDVLWAPVVESVP